MSGRNDVDIDDNVEAYLGARVDTARYSSFDYCFNYFRSFHDAGAADLLGDAEHLEVSCLQLGFYLASWGMFRGKAELLTHSVKRLAPVIDVISGAPRALWEVDADDYGTDAKALLVEAECRFREALPGGQSQTLVTKTMLGVFGCVPAFDRFFRVGFGTSRFGPKAFSRGCRRDLLMPLRCRSERIREAYGSSLHQPATGGRSATVSLGNSHSRRGNGSTSSSTVVMSVSCSFPTTIAILRIPSRMRSSARCGAARTIRLSAVSVRRWSHPCRSSL